jgi:hypothetical protein
MGLHDPFGHLKHKLWPKKSLGVKLAIWLPTTKSQKLTQFLCVKVLWDIPLKSSQRGLQLCFKPHLNHRPAPKVMGPQSCGSPNFGNFGIPKWESQNKNVIWMWASWKGIEYTIRGKVVASFKSGLWWVLWVQVCPWFVPAPKVLQLCTNQLVVWFCASPCEWLNVCHSS